MNDKQAYEKVVKFYKECSKNYEVSFECDDYKNLGIQDKKGVLSTEPISLGIYEDHIEYRTSDYDPRFLKEAVSELRSAGFDVREIKDLPTLSRGPRRNMWEFFEDLGLI